MAVGKQLADIVYYLNIIEIFLFSSKQVTEGFDFHSYPPVLKYVCAPMCLRHLLDRESDLVCSYHAMPGTP